MKFRQFLGTRISPSLRQKQTLVYVAAGIALAVVVAVGLFIYLNLGKNQDSKAAGPDYYSVEIGDWTDGTTWQGGVAPPTTGITSNTEIFRTITQIGDLSYGSGSDKTFTFTDTLVIDGNLTMGNKSNVVVNDGGVLVVIGNFTAENKIIVGNGGVMVIGGSMIFPTNDQDIYT